MTAIMAVNTFLGVLNHWMDAVGDGGERCSAKFGQSRRTLHNVLGYFKDFALPSMDLIKFIIIPATHTTLSKALARDEIVCFICLLFILCARNTQTMSRQDLWSQDPPDIFSGAPFRLNYFMSRRRFELILKQLKFTTKEPPAIKTPFYKVNNLIQGWNKHTHCCFSPSSVKCPDKRMSVWTNRWMVLCLG
jgi:hypothetical protein